MAEAYIVDAVRTPVGQRGGGWPACTRPTSARTCSSALMDRTGVDPAAVEDVDLRLRATPSARRPATSPAPAGWPPACPRRAGRHRRPAVRLLPAGRALRRPGRDVRHPGPGRGRRRAEHVADPDRVAAMLAAEPLGFTDGPFAGSRGWRARYGDQEVSQFRGAEMIAATWDISPARTWRRSPSSRHQRAHPRHRRGPLRRARSSPSAASRPTRARAATPRWRRWPA